MGDAPIYNNDALIVAEVMRRLADAVGSVPQRTDGNVNQRDFYRVLNDEYHKAFNEARDVD